jgi:hypothetical protein
MQIQAVWKVAPIGFAVALGALAPPPTVPPQRMEENVAAGLLKVEPQTIELGEIHRGEKFTREVTLTNISDLPLTIVRAFATCGCTVPEIPEEPIQPGESVVVDVEYLAQNPGETDTLVQFFLEEREGSVTLHVTARVLHPVIVEPASFDPLFENDLPLTLISTDGSEFQIYAVEPDVAKPYEKAPAVRHEVVIDATKAAALRRPFNTIRFYVDHKRTSVVFLRSSKIETTTQTQRIINWAKGAGEVDTLEGLILDGAEVDRPDANGRTPLMYAAQAGQTERALLLIEHGIDVNAMRADGETALMAGAKSPEGNTATLEALVEAGADVNARDQFGRTALFWCARSGDLARLQWLLDAGADINVPGPFRETELIAAVKSRSLAKVRALVEAGADVRAADANGRDAAFHARAATAYSRGPQLEEVRKIISYLEEQVQ